MQPEHPCSLILRGHHAAFRALNRSLNSLVRVDFAINDEKLQAFFLLLAINWLVAVYILLTNLLSVKESFFGFSLSKFVSRSGDFSPKKQDPFAEIGYRQIFFVQPKFTFFACFSTLAIPSSPSKVTLCSELVRIRQPVIGYLGRWLVHCYFINPYIIIFRGVGVYNHDTDS